MTASTTLLVGTLATMTDAGVLADQAVTITDGRISRLEPRETAELRGEVLDWRDRTVLPGLANMHTHVWERADMLLDLAHGVTLLRNTWGNPWHLTWQRDVEQGRELGPHLVTTSPMADGRGASGTTIWPTAARIDDREAAHAAVTRWAALGYQAVKCYSWLTADALQGLGEACRDAGIPLIGHCPQALTVDEAIDAGQTGFEHLNNYDYGALTPAARAFLDERFPPGTSRVDPDAAEASVHIDQARLDDLCERIADEGIVSTPTLIVLDRVLGAKDFNDPRLRYVDPAYARFWRPENDFRLAAFSPAEIARSRAAIRERSGRVVAALRDAGARVLVGTDPPNAFVFHGSSVVEEMELLVESGYGHAEVVEMATRGAADYLGLPDRGRIAVGCVADLVAVSDNPMLSVSALRDPAAVVVGGTVLDRSDLDRLLEEAAQLLHADPDIRWDPLEPDEQLVGEYQRTEFGQPAGRTRVSCCAPGPGLTQWREQVIARGRRERTTTVIDMAGHLVSATIHRDLAAGTEAATVTRIDGSTSYELELTAVDGSQVIDVLDGPLLPGADLCTPASLAAADRAAANGEEVQVLRLAASFANGLPPRPGDLVREVDGLVQHAPDAQVRVEADAALDRYAVSLPMEHVAHERLDQTRPTSTPSRRNLP